MSNTEKRERRNESLEDIEDLSYKDLLLKYMDELRYFHFDRKSEMVRRLADKLKREGYIPEMISAQITEDLRGYDISPQYIRRVLGEEFTQKSKRRYKNCDTFAANQAAAKIPIEISTNGTPITREDEIDKPKPKQYIMLPDDNQDLQLRIGQLEEKLKERDETIKSMAEAVNKNQNKDVLQSKEYKALEADFELLKEERNEYKFVADKMMKQHPQETFQSAATIPKVEPTEITHPKGEFEIEFPAKDLSTLWLDAKNAKKIMYFFVNGNQVVKWESDYAREKRQSKSKQS